MWHLLVPPDAAPRADVSIAAHLTVLLNTRHGSSALDPSYGLGDTTDALHDLPASGPALQRALLDAVRRHEPRLMDPVVRGPTRGLQTLSLCFDIHGRDRDGEPVRLSATLLPGGLVRVALSEPRRDAARGGRCS